MKATSVPEFIDPRFRENKLKTLIFSHRKRAFWACFRENSVYNFGHMTANTKWMALKAVMLAKTVKPVPEIIDPVFAKTSRKRSFCMTENERFGLVFRKTGSINSGTAQHRGRSTAAETLETSQRQQQKGDP